MLGKLKGSDSTLISLSEKWKFSNFINGSNLGTFSLTKLQICLARDLIEKCLLCTQFLQPNTNNGGGKWVWSTKYPELGFYLLICFLAVEMQSTFPFRCRHSLWYNFLCGGETVPLSMSTDLGHRHFLIGARP